MPSLKRTLLALVFASLVGSALADERDPNPSTDGTPDHGPAIYLLDIFNEGPQHLLHWKYNGGMPGWKEVEIADADGKILARIERPGDTFDLSALSEKATLQVTPIADDGRRGVTRSVPLGDGAPRREEISEFGRIGIRSVDGKAEFFNRATGLTFHPRGYNYIPLRGDHSLFQAATSDSTADYDPLDAESALRRIGDAGFNTVRIFLAGRSRENPGLAGEKDTLGVYTPYLDNLANFLARAARHGLYVIMNFCDMDLPHNDYFKKRAGGAENFNRVLLSRPGVEAHMEQVASTLSYLKAKNPDLLKVLLGVEFNNEVAVKLAKWPFDEKGPVTLADGKTYDMSDPAERLRAMEEGLLFYWGAMNGAVKAIDPDLLTCEGAYTAYAVGRDLESTRGYIAGEVAPGYEWDLKLGSRCPPSLPLFARSPLDFIDLHLYLRKPMDQSAKEAADSFASMDFQRSIDGGLLAKKPLILGEFGSHTSNGKGKGDATFAEALKRYDQTRAFACRDYGFTGWLIWTFDTFEQTNIYPAMADDGATLKAFSPFAPWPDHDRNAPILHPDQATKLPLELATVPPTGPKEGFLVPQSLPH